MLCECTKHTPNYLLLCLPTWGNFGGKKDGIQKFCLFFLLSMLASGNFGASLRMPGHARILPPLVFKQWFPPRTCSVAKVSSPRPLAAKSGGGRVGAAFLQMVIVMLFLSLCPLRSSFRTGFVESLVQWLELPEAVLPAMMAFARGLGGEGTETFTQILLKDPALKNDAGPITQVSRPVDPGSTLAGGSGGAFSVPGLRHFKTHNFLLRCGPQFP